MKYCEIGIKNKSKNKRFQIIINRNTRRKAKDEAP